jgi:hypothetical protein
MFDLAKKKFVLAVALVMAMAIGLIPQTQIDAADHNDSSIPTGLADADITDIYAFNDPVDNTKVVLAMGVHGFIVPAEMGNTGFFNPDVDFEFQIANSGTAKPDLFIDITFSALTYSATGARNPQTATVKFSSGQKFTAQTTVPSATAATAPPFVVTTDPTTNISFFAGMTDDPFFFDIPGVGRFVNSVLAGAADPTQLDRGRDSFAGYNVHMITLDIPFALLKGSAGSKISVEGSTFMHKKTILNGKGDISGAGKMVQVDRMGNPAINAELVPPAMRDEYNAGTPEDDAAGKFAPGIVATLTALGTSSTIISTLAGVAVTNGDYLHLDNSVANTTLGVGETVTGTPNFAGFPNGRRPGDDVVGTIIFFVSNETIATGDHVPTNDVPFGSTFPYFAPPHQPQAAGATVGADGTQN